MTTVPTNEAGGHARTVLEEGLADASAEVRNLEQGVTEARTFLAKKEEQLAAARARLADLQRAHSVLSGAPVWLAAREVLTALDGALGMRIGPLTLGVRPDAPVADLEAYAGMMRELQAQALHQVRATTDVVRSRRSYETRLVADACANCGEAISRAGIDSDGPWIHNASQQAACNPSDPLSLPAEPVSQAPDHPYAALLGHAVVLVLRDGTQLTGQVLATPAGRLVVATGEVTPADLRLHEVVHARLAEQTCVCDEHDQHAECGDECPCVEPEPGPVRTAPDAPGPVRTNADSAAVMPPLAELADTHNSGRPVEWVGRGGAFPGALVCAVPSPHGSNRGAFGHGGRLICGFRLDDGPCSRHDDAGPPPAWPPAAPAEGTLQDALRAEASDQ